MGTGKSRLASIIANEISKREGFRIAVLCAESKLETTIPFYEENCEKFVRYKGLTYAMLKKMRDTIFSIEDEPIISRVERRRKVIDSLITAESRANHIYTIITCQDPKKLTKKVGVIIELDVRKLDHFYRVIEGRNATDWTNWTFNPELELKVLNPIFDGIYHGIEGKEIGRAGRPVDKKSVKQRCFRMWDEGKTITEVAKMFPEKKDSIYVYHSRWRKKQH